MMMGICHKDMKTAEEKAKKYADSIIQVVVPGTGVTFTVDDLNEFAQRDYLAGYNEAIRWRDPKEELPELLPNRDYSNNVLAQVEGFTETQVMCLLFVPDDEGGWGYVWGNCYGDINGEAEWDDDYEIIGWRPIE